MRFFFAVCCFGWRKLMPYFLLEHKGQTAIDAADYPRFFSLMGCLSDRSTDHKKFESSVDLHSGQRTLSVMTTNANNRGMALEWAWATDVSDALKHSSKNKTCTLYF